MLLPVTEFDLLHDVDTAGEATAAASAGVVVGLSVVVVGNDGCVVVNEESRWLRCTA